MHGSWIAEWLHLIILGLEIEASIDPCNLSCVVWFLSPWYYPTWIIRSNIIQYQAMVSNLGGRDYTTYHCFWGQKSWAIPSASICWFRCSPCAWFWKARGCNSGFDCTYCHMCPEGRGAWMWVSFRNSYFRFFWDVQAGSHHTNLWRKNPEMTSWPQDSGDWVMNRQEGSPINCPTRWVEVPKEGQRDCQHGHGFPMVRWPCYPWFRSFFSSSPQRSWHWDDSPRLRGFGVEWQKTVGYGVQYR